MLQIKNLSFHFNSKYTRNLITNLTFSVKKGEIKLVNGRSGLGKTTLLNIISGIKIPNLVWKGSVFLNSSNITNLSIEKRKIGLLMQERILFPHFRVLENLLFAIPKDVSNKNDLIKKCLEENQLLGLENYYPSELSGGQISRIACIRTFLSYPDAILLDEPFVSLDEKSKQKLQKFIIKEIRFRNIPYVLVSHEKVDNKIGDGSPIKFKV